MYLVDLAPSPPTSKSSGPLPAVCSEAGRPRARGLGPGPEAKVSVVMKLSFPLVLFLLLACSRAMDKDKDEAKNTDKDKNTDKNTDKDTVNPAREVPLPGRFVLGPWDEMTQSQILNEEAKRGAKRGRSDSPEQAAVGPGVAGMFAPPADPDPPRPAALGTGSTVAPSAWFAPALPSWADSGSPALTQDPQLCASASSASASSMSRSYQGSASSRWDSQGIRSRRRLSKADSEWTLEDWEPIEASHWNGRFGFDAFMIILKCLSAERALYRL
jgi:hypothetical protein